MYQYILAIYGEILPYVARYCHVWPYIKKGQALCNPKTAWYPHKNMRGVNETCVIVFETLCMRPQDRKKTISYSKAGKSWIWSLSGSGSYFYCKCCEKCGPEALKNYSASFWTSNFSVSLWKNPKAHRFMIFGPGGRDHDSKNPLFLI